MEDSFRRLSDFSSDIAHELRTPVSNLLTQTQVMLSRARTVDEYQDVLASNAEELERMAKMIADMLFLAKADNNLVVPNLEAVDLRAEAEGLASFYEAVAEENSVAPVSYTHLDVYKRQAKSSRSRTTRSVSSGAARRDSSATLTRARALRAAAAVTASKG